MTLRTNRLPPESAKDFLETLEADRHELLTEAEYQDWRSWQLQALAHPPSVEWAVFIPALMAFIGGLIGILIGFDRWQYDIESGGMCVLIGLGIGGWGAYVGFGNLQMCRSIRKKSRLERLAEVEEIFTSQLITPEEHEQIKAAIETSAH